jgi:hypothetical protein
MKKISVIDNFLNTNDFIKIKNTIVSNDFFPWYYNPYVVSSDNDLPNNYQFVHLFYNNGEIISHNFTNILPLLEKIDPLSLVRVKANLVPRTEKIVEHGMHIDIDDPKITTAVFYLNTNDGYTVFENGEKVDSKKNRIAFFESQIPHSGSSCTDENVRIVLNINYIERTKT